jgi:hypothetical protein
VDLKDRKKTFEPLAKFTSFLGVLRGAESAEKRLLQKALLVIAIL